MRKLKNNEARPKFTGSYKKKRVFQGFALFGQTGNKEKQQKQRKIEQTIHE